MKINKDELTIGKIKFDNDSDFNQAMLVIAMNHDEGYTPTTKVVELLKQAVEKDRKFF